MYFFSFVRFTFEQLEITQMKVGFDVKLASCKKSIGKCPKTRAIEYSVLLANEGDHFWMEHPRTASLILRNDS